MTAPADVVFLVDCDNTLVDNDGIQDDFQNHFRSTFGGEGWDRYWAIFEELRDELGYADYLGALQRYRLEDPSDTRLLLMSQFLLDYSFETRLYPGALDALRHLSTFGSAVILSDGDVVFQPRKIRRSGVWAAVEGRVIISVHKEEILDAVEARYPARHYVMVDDKLRLLTMIKKVWGGRVTTVFPRQGHYAHDPDVLGAYPAADVTVEGIGDLVTYDLRALVGTAGTARPQTVQE